MRTTWRRPSPSSPLILQPRPGGSFQTFCNQAVQCKQPGNTRGQHIRSGSAFPPPDLCVHVDLYKLVAWRMLLTTTTLSEKNETVIIGNTKIREKIVQTLDCGGLACLRGPIIFSSFYAPQVTRAYNVWSAVGFPSDRSNFKVRGMPPAACDWTIETCVLVYQS